MEKINLRGGDGRRNWAAAQMLPEGSQSWSVRLVAGADLAAADNRLVDPYAERGSLKVADTHYGMLVSRVQLPGGGPVPGGPGDPLVLTEQASLDYWGDGTYTGRPVAELAVQLGMSVEDFCAQSAGLCMNSALVVTEEGSTQWWGDLSFAGRPASELADQYGWTVDEFCSQGPGLCIAQSGEAQYAYDYKPGTSAFSVLRTGTGDLDLVSAGDLGMQSLYGIYTAGSSALSLAESAAFNQPRSLALRSSGMPDTTVLGNNGGSYEALVNGGASSLYRAWYPDHGGNLLLSVGGDLTGDILGSKLMGGGGLDQPESSSVGSWLWRQGGGVNGEVPTAWWINFGTYMPFQDNVAFTGFTGFGTLGAATSMYV